jgi:hypothetical protein
MPAGVGIDIALSNPASPFFDPDHVLPPPLDLSTSMAALLGNINSTAEEVAVINAALNVWDAASGFTNLGMVSDGGGAAGAPEIPAMGELGDIRIGAYGFIFGVLAGSFQPHTESLFLNLFALLGGTAGGDVHMNNAVFWVDDATDVFADPDIDFFTVMLHELGHSLGLGHSSVLGAVMNPNYQGARRSLHADDLQGIQAIYGPALVPGPSTFVLFGTGMVVLMVYYLVLRRRSTSSGSPS